MTAGGIAAGILGNVFEKLPTEETIASLCALLGRELISLMENPWGQDRPLKSSAQGSAAGKTESPGGSVEVGAMS